MAVVPEYSQKAAAPGPVPWFEGRRPIRDVGLGVLAKQTGDWGKKLGEMDAALTKADDESKAIESQAGFALDLDTLLDETFKLPSDKQDAFFSEQLDYRSRQAVDTFAGSKEAREELGGSILTQATSTTLKFRERRRAVQVQNVTDRVNFGLEAAKRKGGDAGRALLEETLSQATKGRHPAMSEEAAAEVRKRYPVDSQLTTSYAAINTNPGQVAQDMTTVLANKEIRKDQRERANTLLGMAKNIQKAQVKQQEALIEAQYQQAVSDTLDKIDAGEEGLTRLITDNEVFDDAEKRKWTGRAVNRFEESKTDWAVYNKGVDSLLASWTGEMSPEMAREQIAKGRYDDTNLSQNDYDRLRGWSKLELGPEAVSAVNGAIDTVKGLDTWMPNVIERGAPKRVAQATNMIMDEVARLKQAGQPVRAKDLDILARQHVAQIAQRGFQGQMMKRIAENNGLPTEPVLDALSQKPSERPNQGAPETMEVFMAEVSRLKTMDPEAARKYYDKWSGRWSGK